MGSIGSKSQNSATASMNSSPSKVSKEKNCVAKQIGLENILLDPRSPDVNRTPLTSILNNRMKNRANLEQTPVTPAKYLRNRLLNHSAKDMKLFDPRSPSQFIPRTPLNMSFDGDNVETSANQYSLDYSGCIEEASCRNFNERLANITFDDVYTTDLAQKTAHQHLEKIADISIPNGTGDDEQLPIELTIPKSHNQTPIASSEIPKHNHIHIDDDNISPVIDVTSNNKRNAVSAFSSTPISTANNQLKTLLQKKHTIKTGKTEIFTDDMTDKATEFSTPTKRLAKIRETENPRTPFGSLLNRRAKSVENLTQQLFGFKENIRPNNENDENVTPKMKTTDLMKQVNRSGGLCIRKNDIFHD